MAGADGPGRRRRAGGRRSTTVSAEFEMVADEARLDELVEELAAESRYGIDTEFHRERTYFPKLALVQIAWRDQIALVDPLAVDPRRLSPLLESTAIAILHAADQDLEVLQHACGAVPARFFDTQIAAGFIGMATPSLAALTESLVGTRLGKGDRLTDWLARPLGDDQLAYAAADVAHLLGLHDELVSRLSARGRLAWAEAECEVLRARTRTQRDPATAWLRLKDLRHLSGPALAVAREVAAWREERAARLDVPVRNVLADLAVAGVSQRRPRSADELRGVRGIDGRSLRSGVVEELLEAVERGLAAPPATDVPKAPSRPERDLRPAVALASAWVSQLARDAAVDPALLGTRADIEALLRGDDDARLTMGWRGELAGGALAALLAGDAALAFAGEGALVLERRSHAPWAT